MLKAWMMYLGKIGNYLIGGGFAMVVFVNNQ